MTIVIDWFLGSRAVYDTVDQFLRSRDWFLRPHAVYDNVDRFLRSRMVDRFFRSRAGSDELIGPLCHVQAE